MSGNFGVLPDHVPTLGVLKPGVLTVYETEATKKYFGKYLNATSKIKYTSTLIIKTKSLKWMKKEKNSKKKVYNSVHPSRTIFYKTIFCLFPLCTKVYLIITMQVCM